MSLFHQSYLLHLLFSFDAFFFYLILLLTGFVPLSIRNFLIFYISFSFAFELGLLLDCGSRL